MSTQILKGLRVLDLSRMLSGPYCTMMLADHGAEVIKIEDKRGDTSRNNGPFRDDDPEHDWAGYFVSLNRNKKSVQLDLKSEAGKEAFRKLAASADVIVENFRPGVMDRLGLSYESLAETNPALVYAAIRGFGDPRTGDSPYGKWPSYDVVAQAMGGLMAVTGPDADTPTKVGPGIGDVFAGMMMSFGVMTALREAEATGKGQFLDVAMYDAMISLCERAVYLHDMTGEIPKPEGNGHPLLAPFGLFPTNDGSVALGIVDDSFWQVLATAMGKPELGTDPRYATRAARSGNATEVNGMVGDWTAQRSKADLTEILGGNVPFGPLNTIEDIFRDPHVAARKMLTHVPHPDPSRSPWTVAANPLRFGGHPPTAFASPPRLGEHTETFLNAAETPPMSDEEKRSLRGAFGTFATGVTVVTTRQKDGTPRGFTANSFSSVSLDPPLLLVCIAKSAFSCDTFAEADHFAVNILSEDQKAVSGLFASRAPDKFEQADWHPGYAEMPVLDGSLGSFVCERHKLVDAGDHLILIGLVKEHAKSDSQPLGYFGGSYFSIGLEEPLVNAAGAGGKVSIGAVMERDQKILLQKLPDGDFCVPHTVEGNSSLDRLTDMLKTKGLTAQLDYLYAIYSESETGHHGIYYHGTVSGNAPENMAYFELSELPLENIPSTAERSMLSRYRDEYKHGSFGIYQGDEASGLVHKVAGMHQSKH
ncbi:Crotonobetainyl-CoA:carnitine CoA-transferase CaiB [Shimia gijangensis]|uniref:Crotonobetainyl-CoA:carnitine CoA-transferase CaiB n=1 Tax=Shimia gijangensis TaxID=1470563 RepID=A0A1M6C951_9RHOB|nr:CoA transferase [Shimia gijangensis]SHI57552.1 Crotonobetainyl-CoA:carnitine CoA-transferase CaiB [Shimia gijangensis]